MRVKVVHVPTPRSARAAGPLEHRTKPEHGDQTKAKLLALARELFGRQGHGGVALQELCDRAGVTRGALYHHFAGKDELFRAVCEQVAQEVSQRLIEEAVREPTAWSRLQAGCAAFLDECARPEVQQILLTDGPAVLGWEAFRELDSRHGLGLLKAGLQSAIEEGVVPSVLPVDTTAHLLVGALNEASMVIARAEDTNAARGDAMHSIRRLLAGIAEPDVAS
jgi:AcrR family transcriptional regulator